MWSGRHLLLFLLALVKCKDCTDFQPVRRYHPAGKLNSDNHDDLVTAENFQYAYSGGESEGVVNYNQDHKVYLHQGSSAGIGSSFPTGLGQHSSLTTSLGQGHSQTQGAGLADLTASSSNLAGYSLPTGLGQHSGQSSSLTTSLGQGHSQTHGAGLADLTASSSNLAGYSLPTGLGQHSGQGSSLTTSLGQGHSHVGEVELTGSGSDLAGYSYGPPEHHGYLPPNLPGYSYVPPDHPLVYTKPPQQAKQSPSYTYYYLGRHLWYIPLYFSIYFILYVGALVLKSVARHKILFPENLKEAAVAAQARSLRQLQQGQHKFYM